MSDVLVEINGNTYTLDGLISETVNSRQRQQINIPLTSKRSVERLQLAERDAAIENINLIFETPGDYLPYYLQVSEGVIENHLSSGMQIGSDLRRLGYQDSCEFLQRFTESADNQAIIINAFAAALASAVNDQLKESIDARINVLQSIRLLHALVDGTVVPFTEEQLTLDGDPLSAIDSRLDALSSPITHDEQPPSPTPAPEPAQADGPTEDVAAEATWPEAPTIEWTTIPAREWLPRDFAGRFRYTPNV